MFKVAETLPLATSDREWRPTPSAGGYAAMFGLVFVLFGLVMGGLAGAEGIASSERPVDVLVGTVQGALLFTVFSAIFGAIPAVLGIVLVHFACRRVRWQWVHVLAFGVAAAVLPWPFLGGFGADELWPFVPIAAGCAAVTRLAVVPWVPSVRSRRHADGV